MAKSAMFSAIDGFKITPPALVTLVGYAILLFVVLLPVDMFTYDDKLKAYVKQKYSFPYRLLIALLLLFPFLLSVYSVNCIIIGNCHLWGWILALLTLLWAVVITVTTFTSGSLDLDQLM